MFNERDSIATVNASKNIINEISDNILRNLRLVDNRTDQELIDDQFILIDDRTQQKLEDDDYISLDEEIIDTLAAWNPKKTKIPKSGQIIKLSLDYNKKLRAANKIKNKNKKKIKKLVKETREIMYQQNG